MKSYQVGKRNNVVLILSLFYTCMCTLHMYVYILVGSVTEVNEYVEEILSLCGEAPSLELLRCVQIIVIRQ